MAPMRSLTDVKVPRRIAWRVMIEKKISEPPGIDRGSTGGSFADCERHFAPTSDRICAGTFVLSAVAGEDDFQRAGLVGAGKDVVCLDEVIETEPMGHETFRVDLDRKSVV